MGIVARLSAALILTGVAVSGTSPAMAGVPEGIAALDRFDYRAAMSEFSDAASMGDAEGQYQLGLLYMLGHGGIQQDYGRAAQWFQRAAGTGHPRAMYMLANLYATGNGVERNYDEARKLMLTAEPGLRDATRLSARATAVMIAELLEARRRGVTATPVVAAPVAATSGIARPQSQPRPRR